MATVIYGAVDPRSEELRYVGKVHRKDGEDDDGAIRRRFRGHRYDGKKPLQSHRHKWLRALSKAGVEPEAFAIETVGNSSWEEAERFWITYFRFLGCRLVNATDGGEGITGHRHDPETIEKIKAGRARRGPTSPEGVRRIIEGSTSPKAKTRRQVSLRRYWDDEDHSSERREQRSRATQATRSTPASRAKTGARMKKQHQDPLFRASFDAAKDKRVAGIRVSRTCPEYIARASVAGKAAWSKHSWIWWTNSAEERRIGLYDQAPKGWRRGRMRSWWTNGTEDRSIRLDEVPNGWRPGRSKKTGGGRPRKSAEAT